MMRFRLAFWHRDFPAAQPGDIVEVPDNIVAALTKAGIGHAAEPELPAEQPKARTKQAKEPETTE